jgi:predicted small integral membrane protein
MFSKSAKLALVATSFAPVLLTIGWIRLVDEKIWPAISYFAAAVLTVGLCLLLISAARSQLEVIPFHPTSTSTADAEVVGFVLAYLLPFVDASGVSVKPSVFWFVMALLGLVVWSTNSYHVNPVLGLLGFHFYEVTTEGDITFVLITRRNLRDSGKIKNVVQLTEYMVLEVKE